MSARSRPDLGNSLEAGRSSGRRRRLIAARRPRHAGLALAGALAVAAYGCGTSDYIGRNGGYRLPKPGATERIRESVRASFKDTFEGEAEADEVAKGAVAFLPELFGDSYNWDLPDVVVYFNERGVPKAPVLVLKKKAVQILDREAVVWAVVIAEPGADGKCSPFKVRLTTIAETRPNVALGINDFLASILSKGSQGYTAADPKEETVPTELVEASPKSGRPLCWAQRRFVVPKDSFERMSFQRVKEKDDDVTKVKIMNEPLRVAVEGVAPAPAPTPTPAPAPPRAPASAPAPADAPAPPPAPARAPAPVPAAAAAPAPPNGPEPMPAAIYNFANSRIPRYGASVALGVDIYNLNSGPGQSGGSSCKTSGGCVPTLYVFVQLWNFPLPYAPTWDHRPYFSVAPVVGVRVLNPALGEAVAGVRLGFEDGLSQGLSRFGIVGGIGYAFRSFDKSGTSTTTTMTTTTTTTTTIGSTTMSEQTEVKNVMVQDHEPNGADWHLMVGLDFAF